MTWTTPARIPIDPVNSTADHFISGLPGDSAGTIFRGRIALAAGNPQACAEIDLLRAISLLKRTNARRVYRISPKSLPNTVFVRTSAKPQIFIRTLGFGWCIMWYGDVRHWGAAMSKGLLRRAKKRTTLLLISCLLLTACGGGAPSVSETQSSGSTQKFKFFRMVDGSDYPNTIQYAYGPSIIYKDSVYHVFFCSGGNDIFPPAFDYVRYVKSTDGGNTWTAPIDMLHGNTELGACDPSVVYYQGYYYMFFGSAYYTAGSLTQTITEVARSLNIDGPYLTYTERGTWEDTPSDAKVIIKPLVFHDTSPTGYGAGQPAVVVHDGKLMMWYTDDSETPGSTSLTYATTKYMLESTDPVTWTPSTSRKINIAPQDSIDVKFDAAKNQFVMTHILDPFDKDATLTRIYSSDGMTWGNAEIVINSSVFPGYTNNVGVAGDESGNTLQSSTLVGFGAPPKLGNFYSPGSMDMYGVFVDPP